MITGAYTDGYEAVDEFIGQLIQLTEEAGVDTGYDCDTE